MEDTTRHPAFEPVPLDQNVVLRIISSWQAARIIEDEGTWLLRQCFPGWAEQGDPAARPVWTRMCRELLISTGELLDHLWATVRPAGGSYLMSRHSDDGLRLMVGLVAGDQNVQVHLGALVLTELRRERTMDVQVEPKTFTFLDIMRREYQKTPDQPTAVPQEKGVLSLVKTMTGSWLRDLRDALIDPETWRLPESTPPNNTSS
ncbi:hypothetical protein [Deinococcus aluminii]|uniref:Uncharacterized protein n=1 Tax=Deinococcus aluminii TaxID=1656885 RepID=A0ABP9XKN1_9DEIO